MVSEGAGDGCRDVDVVEDGGEDAVGELRVAYVVCGKVVEATGLIKGPENISGGVGGACSGRWGDGRWVEVGEWLCGGCDG